MKIPSNILRISSIALLLASSTPQVLCYDNSQDVRTHQNTESTSTSTLSADDEPNAKTLDEVVVEAKRAIKVEDGLRYIPTPKEKRSAPSAEYLLGLMPISSLRFDWASGSATSISGNEIRYYINGREATSWEIHMIRKSDVSSIDVLENPVDPKYQNAPIVINYIVREYDYGAYVMLDAEQWLHTDFGRYGASGKYTRGPWSVSANGGYQYHTNHTFSDSYTEFDMSDIPSDVITRSQSSEYVSRTQRASAIARVVYQKDELYILNDVGFGYDETPDGRTDMTKIYDPETVPLKSYDRQSSKMWSIRYQGLAYYNLHPNVDGFEVTWGYNYSDFTGKNNYTTDQPQIPAIITDSYDSNHNASLSGRYFRYFSPKHLFQAIIGAEERYNRMKYTGTTVYSQNTLNTIVSLQGSYNYIPSDNTRMSLKAYVAESFIDAGEHGKTDFLKLRVNYNYKTVIANSHQLNATASYTRDGLSAATFNTARILNNEIEGRIGNNRLKPSDNLYISSYYTYFASNRVQLSASLSYNAIFDDIISMHMPYDGVMYSMTYNSGTYNMLSPSISVSYSIIPGTLMVDPYVSYTHHWHSGDLDIDRGNVMVSVPVTYVSPFGLVVSLSPAYQSPDSYQYGYILHKNQPWSLFLSMSYTYRNLSAQLGVSNFWYKNFTQTRLYNEPFYHQENRETIMRRGRGIMLSLSYTFNLGKQIRREQLEYNSGYNSGLL